MLASDCPIHVTFGEFCSPSILLLTVQLMLTFSPAVMSFIVEIILFKSRVLLGAGTGKITIGYMVTNIYNISYKFYSLVTLIVKFCLTTLASVVFLVTLHVNTLLCMLSLTGVKDRSSCLVFGIAATITSSSLIHSIFTASVSLRQVIVTLLPTVYVSELLSIITPERDNNYNKNYIRSNVICSMNCYHLLIKTCYCFLEHFAQYK